MTPDCMPSVNLFYLIQTHNNVTLNVFYDEINQFRPKNSHDTYEMIVTQFMNSNQHLNSQKLYNLATTMNSIAFKFDKVSCS